MADRRFDWRDFRRYADNPITITVTLPTPGGRDCDFDPVDLSAATFEYVLLPNCDADIGDAYVTLTEADVTVSGSGLNVATFAVPRAVAETIPAGVHWHFLNIDGVREFEGDVRVIN